jgi:hypothetical protein
MGIRVPVSTPTPHLDYTIRFNREHAMKEKKHHDDQVKTEHRYDVNLKALQDKQRIDKTIAVKQELDALYIYADTQRRQGYKDYKYLFYIGTTVDTYI